MDEIKASGVPKRSKSRSQLHSTVAETTASSVASPSSLKRRGKHRYASSTGGATDWNDIIESEQAKNKALELEEKPESGKKNQRSEKHGIFGAVEAGVRRVMPTSLLSRSGEVKSPKGHPKKAVVTEMEDPHRIIEEPELEGSDDSNSSVKRHGEDQLHSDEEENHVKLKDKKTEPHATVANQSLPPWNSAASPSQPSPSGAAPSSGKQATRSLAKAMEISRHEPEHPKVTEFETLHHAGSDMALHPASASAFHSGGALHASYDHHSHLHAESSAAGHTKSSTPLPAELFTQNLHGTLASPQEQRLRPHALLPRLGKRHDKHQLRMYRAAIGPTALHELPAENRTAFVTHSIERMYFTTDNLGSMRLMHLRASPTATLTPSGSDISISTGHHALAASSAASAHYGNSDALTSTTLSAPIFHLPDRRASDTHSAHHSALRPILVPWPSPVGHSLSIDSLDLTGMDDDLEGLEPEEVLSEGEENVAPARLFHQPAPVPRLHQSSTLSSSSIINSDAGSEDIMSPGLMALKEPEPTALDHSQHVKAASYDAPGKTTAGLWGNLVGKIRRYTPVVSTLNSTVSGNAAISALVTPSPSASAIHKHSDSTANDSTALTQTADQGKGFTGGLKKVLRPFGGRNARNARLKTSDGAIAPPPSDTPLHPPDHPLHIRSQSNDEAEKMIHPLSVHLHPPTGPKLQRSDRGRKRISSTVEREAIRGPYFQRLALVSKDMHRASANIDFVHQSGARDLGEITRSLDKLSIGYSEIENRFKRVSRQIEDTKHRVQSSNALLLDNINKTNNAIAFLKFKQKTKPPMKLLLTLLGWIVLLLGTLIWLLAATFRAVLRGGRYVHRRFTGRSSSKHSPEHSKRPTSLDPIPENADTPKKRTDSLPRSQSSFASLNSSTQSAYESSLASANSSTSSLPAVTPATGDTEIAAPEEKRESEPPRPATPPIRIHPAHTPIQLEAQQLQTLEDMSKAVRGLRQQAVAEKRRAAKVSPQKA